MRSLLAPSPMLADKSPLSPSMQWSRRASPQKEESRCFFMLGVFTFIATFVIIIAMLTGAPTTSEEAEIIAGISATMRSAQKEWVAPEVLYDSHSLSIGERPMVVMLYRLRTVVLVDLARADATARLAVFIKSLVAANYKSRVFPVDIEFHLIGPAAPGQGDPLPRAMEVIAAVAWWHGRVTVTRQVQHSNSPGLSPTALWLPTSDFEVAIFFDLSQGEQAPRVAPSWFSWFLGALTEYGTVPPQGFHPLAAAQQADGPHSGAAASQLQWYVPAQHDRLASPAPHSLLGFSLDMPYSSPSDPLPTSPEEPRSFIGGPFFKWRDASVHAQDAALLVQRPGLVASAFFAQPWRSFSASWTAADAIAPSSSPLVPWHTVHFQRWMSRNSMSMVFPVLLEHVCLASDRLSIPLSVIPDADIRYSFPPFTSLRRFDRSLVPLK